ncbi:BldC family transcriptional regulator [Streptosporangium canum]|uniref:BldC family transcriptional regulator n=1 Tax=Streptosporangium canum TaxID=324952 RepID=UPI003436C3DA
MSIMPLSPLGEERLLTSEEVATVFHVDPKTITRWAAAGLIRAIRTPGGRLFRYRPADIRAILSSPDGQAEVVEAVSA